MAEIIIRKITSNLTNSRVHDVTKTNGGSSYTSPPTVVFSGGGGTGAKATATVSSGSVTDLVMDDQGIGYTSAPTVTITGGGGTGATGEAVMSTNISTFTYHVKNLTDLNFVLDQPFSKFTLPQMSAASAITMKVEGSSEFIDLTWTLIDEDSTVVDELTGNNAVETADEQMKFLLNDLASTGIEDKYQFKLMPSTGGSKGFFERSGACTKIQINKSGSTPVTYTATIQFTVGNVISTVEESSASDAE